MFRFNLLKTLQAVSVILRAHPVHVMSKLRLLKLLYIADRESLRETGAPITGDRVVAMQHGPVLSETYDLIKGEHIRAAEWTDHFENIGYSVRLISDPGTARLSRYEIEKLNAVTQQFEHQGDWAVAEETHSFEEWQRNAPPGDSSKPIPLEHVLEAVGRKKDIKAIRRDAEAVAFIDRVLGDP